MKRLSKLAIALFKTILTFGLAVAFSSVRSQWREALWGRKEIVIVGKMEGLAFPLHLSNASLSAFYNYIDESYPHRISLYLGHEQITQFPINACNLVHLQELWLHHNQLQTIPDTIGNLTNLQELLLYDNQLQTIPDTIGNLTNLQELGLGFNRIQTLPDTIGRLINLKALGLEHNQLQTIPDTIGNLTNLQELGLNNNQLQTIPDTIGSLTNLQKLGLFNNRLQAIPGTIVNLTSLQELRLGFNRIQTLPETIGNLTNLQKLGLNNNQLQTIPDTIGSLTNLRKLQLDGNQLQTIPDTISCLANLQTLWLKYNQLQIIPECLYRLPRTCEVQLEGNPISQEAIEQARTRINAEGYQGPRFFFSIHEARGQNYQPQDLRSILPEWCEDPCKRSLLERMSLEQQNNLANWLARLKGTADYKTREQAVKDKVKYLLAWLAEETNADHLQPAHQILAEATSTCGDRVALSLNTLSLHVKICQSSNLGLPELKRLIIGSDRYDRLSKIAEQKCGQLRLVDPIEVHLCYQIHLKDALGLPIETNNMLYERLSDVTQADIENARQQILADTGPERQIDILLEHPMWKKALESSQGFEQIKNSCDQQKEEALSHIDTTDESAAEQFYQEFQEKDKTVWTPYYLLTNLSFEFI